METHPARSSDLSSLAGCATLWIARLGWQVRIAPRLCLLSFSPFFIPSSVPLVLSMVPPSTARSPSRKGPRLLRQLHNSERDPSATRDNSGTVQGNELGKLSPRKPGPQRVSDLAAIHTRTTCLASRISSSRIFKGTSPMVSTAYCPSASQ
jgi:hypothetical protein